MNETFVFFTVTVEKSTQSQFYNRLDGNNCFLSHFAIYLAFPTFYHFTLQNKPLTWAVPQLPLSVALGITCP